MDAPSLIVVGGPNGSGKSTFALDYAERFDVLYLGADQIASQISPEDPAAVRIEASRQFLSMIRKSITNQESMIVESTLAGKSLRKLIESAKNVGFKVTIVFVFLDSAMLVLNVCDNVFNWAGMKCLNLIFDDDFPVRLPISGFPIECWLIFGCLSIMLMRRRKTSRSEMIKTPLSEFQITLTCSNQS